MIQVRRSVGALCASLLLLTLVFATGPHAAGKGARSPAERATFELARDGLFPPRSGAATSPLFHPGGDVFLPTGGVFHARRLFTIPGNGHTRDYELRHLSGVTYDGQYGRDWWSTLDARIELLESGDVNLHDTDGSIRTFAADGPNYVSPADRFVLLEAVRKGRKQKLKGWRLLHPDRSVWEFDKRGRWTRIVRPDGQRDSMKRDSRHVLRRYKTAEGRTYTWKYGRDRRLASLKIPGKRTFCFEYDDQGRLNRILRPVRKTDTEAQAWTYSYDAENRLTAVRNSAGDLTSAFQYDATGRCLRVLDALDRAATFDYAIPEQVRCTGRDGFDRIVRFDASGATLGTAAFDGAELISSTVHVRDPRGRVLSTSHSEGDSREFTYDDSGDPRSAANVLTNTHLPADFPATDSATTTFTFHPGTSLVTSQVNPDGWRLDVDPGFDGASTFDANSVLRLTLPEHLTPEGLKRPVTERRYDSRGRLAEVIEADGTSRRYTYGKKRQERDLVLAEILDAGTGTDPVTGAPRVNRTVEYSYDKIGRLARQVRSGSVELFQYDAWDTLAASIDGEGIRGSFETDAAGFVTARERPYLDPDGDPIGSGVRRETFRRDALGRILEEVHLDGFGGERKVGYEYDAGHSKPTLRVSPNGTEERYVYDALQRLVQRVRAPGRDEEAVDVFTYSAVSYDVSRKFGEAASTQENHDGFGRVRTVVDGEGRVTKYERDADGRVQTRTVLDDLGTEFSRERYRYDPAGNLVSVERDRFDPTDLGVPVVVEESTTTYTLRGFPAVETNAEGATTTYVYDGAAQVVSRVEQPLDVRHQYTYDSAGRIVEREVTSGLTTQSPSVRRDLMEWDDCTQLIRRVDALGGEVAIRYDSLGNGVEVTEPAGRVTRTSYDALGRLLSATRSNPAAPTLAQTTSYDYDAAGNLLRATLPTGDALTYTYDALNRLSTESRNEREIASFTYDSVDQVRTRTDGAGRTVTFSYDQIGRVRERAASTGGGQTFTWDANDRLLRGSDSTGAATYGVQRTYDSLGNVLTDVQPGGTVIQSYGNGGTWAGLVSPDGFRYQYAADDAGRITSVMRDGSPYLSTRYAPGSRKPAEHAHAALVSTFEYDALGNLVRVASDAIGVTQPDVSSTATYDASGNRTSQTREDGKGERWEYDALGRLVAHYTDATSPAAGTPTEFDTSTRYTFDAASNRLTAIDTDPGGPAKGPGKRSAITYDAQGRPDSVDGQPLTYAGAGHATNWWENRPAHDAGERKLTLDVFGRITEVRRASDSSILGSFGYDVLDRPVVADEEEFTGNVVLNRRRVFVGCRLIAELSPTPLTGFDGFDLFFVPDPATNGYFANGFKETFFSELFHQRDCRGMQVHGYSGELMQHNESFFKFGPQGLPYFEFPPGTPFRGAPSLNSVVNAPGLVSASISGVIFDWAADSDDPFLPRKLVQPPDRVNPWGLPRPDPPVPGPAQGDPVGDEDEDWVDTSPDPEDVDSTCEDAIKELERLLARLAKIESEAAKVNQDLFEFEHWRNARLSKLSTVREGLDEILNAQEGVRGNIDFLRSLDYYLTNVDVLVGAAGEVKQAFPNFKDMSKAMKDTLASKTSKQLDDAVADFAASAFVESARQGVGAVKSFNRRTALGYVEDTITGGNELGISTPGAIGYNIASKLRGLFGGMTLGELLSEYDRQFGIGLESIKTLLEELGRLDRAIADRRDYQGVLRRAAASACNAAEQALARLAEVWGEADAKAYRDRLAAAKADLARQNIR